MHIVVGLSGGVDSAVAAWRLQQQGHRVSGLFMKNWEDDDRDGHCAAAADLADAERVCERLGIELHTVNFAFEYWDRVFAHFLAEHRAGRTPNPDVLCNKEIKFKEFMHHARTLGAERIATGHYVRRTGAACRLLKGLDRAKDQSYFLHAVNQAALAITEFPLGELTKPEVRRIAARLGLPNHAKKDSTGICFIGERRLRTFLARYIAPQPGEILDLAGCQVGRHAGLMSYTIGQRRGLDIGGAGEAWYVAAKDLRRNVLRVVQGHDHPALYRNTLLASQLDWIAGRAPPLPLACHAKTRYRQADQACEVTDPGEGRVRVRFAQPQRAITPGQSVVFYDGDICLGGGVIESAAHTTASQPRPLNSA